MTSIYKTGDRRSRISITTNLNITGSTHGVISNWLNGSDNQDASGSFFPDALSNNTGKEIKFTFNSNVTVDEIRIRQSGNQTRGSWQAYIGSTPIGSPFILGGSASQILTLFNGNLISSNEIKFVGVGGAVSDGGWMNEIEFKEDDIAIIEYCNPRPNPWPRLISPIEDDFTRSLPTRTLTPEYSGPDNYSPPYTMLYRTLVEGCLPGDKIIADWQQIFTVPGPQIMEISGFLMLQKSNDPDTAISMYNAGPEIDFRLMCDNRGQNVTQEMHHSILSWKGKTLINVAGDYYVSAFAYASPGDFLTPIGIISIHDGELFIERRRSV